MSALAAAEVADHQPVIADADVHRARRGLDLILRTAAENGFSLRGQDLSDPDARRSAFHLLARNAALSQCDLRESLITQFSGMNATAEGRARVHAFRVIDQAMYASLMGVVTILGERVVADAITRGGVWR